MFISLKSNVMIKFSKIYSLDHKNHKIIDVTFNKLYQQNKLRFFIQSILYN